MNEIYIFTVVIIILFSFTIFFLCIAIHHKLQKFYFYICITHVIYNTIHSRNKVKVKYNTNNKNTFIVCRLNNIFETCQICCESQENICTLSCCKHNNKICIDCISNILKFTQKNIHIFTEIKCPFCTQSICILIFKPKYIKKFISIH